MKDRPSLPRSNHRSFSFSNQRETLVLMLIFSAGLMLSCAFLDGIASQIAPTSSEHSETQVPPDTAVAATQPSVSTETTEPSPSSPTETSEPTEPTPTVTPTESVWETISGTWSGCLVSNPSPDLNDLSPCTEPVGNFVTLYLLPVCDQGEICGNYIKGTFDSEYILLKLTLNEIRGAQVLMYGDAGTGMFSWASTDLTIERSGGELTLIEASGEGYVLLPSCDPVIQQNVSAGCFEQIQ